MTFAQDLPPGRALKAMRHAGIDKELRPSAMQIKNQRRKFASASIPDVYSADCVGELRDFLRNPPDGLLVLEDHVVLTSDCIRVPFCLDSDIIDQIWQDSNMNCCLRHQ